MSTLLYGKSKNGELVFDNKKELVEYLLTVEGKSLVIRIERETGVRSAKQNSSLHLYFELLAAELNSSGYTIQKLLSHAVDLEWSAESIKELLWRPIQKALIKKKSTTQLDRVSEIDQVYDHINRYLSEFGIHVVFPSVVHSSELRKN